MAMNRRKFLTGIAGVTASGVVLAKSDRFCKVALVPDVELVPSFNKEHICVKQLWKDRKSNMAKYTWHNLVKRACTFRGTRSCISYS